MLQHSFIYVILCTSLCAPTRKLVGRLISEILQLVESVTGVGSGLVMAITSEALLRTGVHSLIVPIIPGGVDLKLT